MGARSCLKRNGRSCAPSNSRWPRIRRGPWPGNAGEEGDMRHGVLARTAVVILGLLVGWGSQAAAQTKMRVGHIVDIDSIPLLVMVQKGIDKKHGLEVELNPFPGSSPAHTALRGGALDSIANMGTNAAALLNAEGG